MATKAPAKKSSAAKKPAAGRSARKPQAAKARATARKPRAVAKSSDQGRWPNLGTPGSAGPQPAAAQSAASQTAANQTAGAAGSVPPTAAPFPFGFLPGGMPGMGFPQMPMASMNLPGFGMPGMGAQNAGMQAFAPVLEQLFGKSAKGPAPEALQKLQAEYLQRCQELLAQASKGAAPALKDKRFADASWQNNGMFTWNAALYLLNAEFLQRMADSVEGDTQTRDRVKFAVQQWVDALSPANYLVSNPEAQKLMVETQGRSLVAGAENMIGDIQRGRISQTDESAFEVGRNVATTPGAVVYQNDLVQLIQYTPTTATVYKRPLMLVPPCINKFYILDLQPENSFVAHAVSEGHQVFVVSWKNVREDQGHLGWDDYLDQGVVKTIEVVQKITKQDKINALGFCVGGTILSAALAALAAKGQEPVTCLTLMTTLLDFEEPGVLGVFIDEQQVAMREQTLGNGGLLRGQELATTFSFLRPNDLVWNYVVSNYLKGQQPPAFDLLYWNGDSTNLPGPMYAWYLRHLYLQNELRIPNRLQSLGAPVDLGKITVPTYVFAAKEDHIVPWKAAFRNTHLIGGPLRFVLGASGHIAGAINPASKNKRSYWTGKLTGGDADTWLASAHEQPGSWWVDWRNWLREFAGDKMPTPSSLGGNGYRPIEPAPGSYVKQRAE